MPRTIRRRPAPALVALLVATTALLAACGGGDDAADEGTAAAPAAEDGTVTVTHAYGETEVAVGPERVVSLDTQWTDVLLALDAPPAGYAADPTLEGGTYPWRGAGLGASEPIDVGRGASLSIPYEAVAALQPDLIVVSFGVQSESDYERLSAIAPTIPLLGDEEVDAWQDMAEVAGRVLGDEEAAADLVADAEAEAAAVREALPGLEGATVALANYVPGDAIYVVADPDDGSSTLFSQLGLEITPTILDRADGATGRVELSLENLDLLDSDVLVLFTNGADPGDIPGYANLPAVRSGAVATLDYADVTGLNTPTPLSIPWSLERIRPALEAAAGGGG
ncbi:ABC transporter substrate-binding protein [Iamia majanohamensis]|uniref:ABC transporter substrate-binding protein n=1 Tax=Iamia majanohamensis TaxID=467976 RepID=A0AAE9Y8X8_9ACTN|nr:ABC transporter substrate-binding protein [Iamia majanohamensis]WCO68787.1 ABC transporter substrate-binding protein [Iamia majanohamensis]